VALSAAALAGPGARVSSRRWPRTISRRWLRCSREPCSAKILSGNFRSFEAASRARDQEEMTRLLRAALVDEESVRKIVDSH
jgi:hypothetical protein